MKSRILPRPLMYLPQFFVSQPDRTRTFSFETYFASIAFVGQLPFVGQVHSPIGPYVSPPQNIFEIIIEKIQVLHWGKNFLILQSIIIVPTFLPIGL